MAGYTEITNPGVISADAESFIFPIVANPGALPPSSFPDPVQPFNSQTSNPAFIPVTTNPPQVQLVTGVAVNVVIK